MSDAPSPTQEIPTSASCYLFHGTRYLTAIMATNMLKTPPYGDTHVSLTYSLDEALYWASLERDDDDGRGGIIVLDRRKLEAAGYAPQPFTSDAAHREEHELAVASNIDPLSDFIIGIIATPKESGL